MWQAIAHGALAMEDARGQPAGYLGEPPRHPPGAGRRCARHAHRTLAARAAIAAAQHRPAGDERLAQILGDPELAADAKAKALTNFVRVVFRLLEAQGGKVEA